MDPSTLVVFLALGLSGGLLSNAMAHTTASRRRRLLRELPTTRVLDAVDGKLSKVVGTVAATHPDGPLIAPFSRRPCVYYRVEAFGPREISWNVTLPAARLESERNGGGAPGGLRLEAWHDFAVSDESGAVLVRSDGALPLLGFFEEETAGFFSRPSPAMSAFLAKNGIAWSDQPVRRFLVREWCVAAGARVALVGTARWELSSDKSAVHGAAYRDAPRQLVLHAEGEAGLTVSDYVGLPTR